MQIESNKVVSLTYKLHVSEEGGDQQLVEQVEKENPFTFVVGAGKILETFEGNLKGKTPGDNFGFSLNAEEGYGNYDPNAVAKVPLEIFSGEGINQEELLQKGNFIPMQDNQGNRLQGKVMDVTEEEVVMDFNHPLAGKSLHFEGEIVAVREATNDEKSSGIPAEHDK